MVMQGQWVDLRMLYPTWAGGALMLGAGLALLENRPALLRLGLGATAGILLTNTLGLAGMTRAYQLRWETDQRQLAALHAAIPDLPSVSPVWIWPAEVDQHSIEDPDAAALDGYLISVYEMSWAAEGAVRMLYRRPDVQAVTRNKAGSWELSALERAPDGTVTALILQQQRVPVANLIAFAAQAEGLILYSPLLIQTETETLAISLPLVEASASPEHPPEPFPIPFKP